MSSTPADHIDGAMLAVMRGRARLRDRYAEENAAQLVMSFPYLADACRRVTTTLGLETPDRVVERVALTADALHDASHRAGWPGQGPLDLDARTAIHRLRRASAGSVTQLQDDRAQLQQKVVATVWMFADLVTTAVNGYARDLQRLPRLPDHAVAALPHVKSVGLRTGAATQLAASGLHFAHGRTGADTGVVAALAEWDLQAHRALLSGRSTTAIHVIATLESDVAGRLAQGLIAAHRRGDIDAAAKERCMPGLVVARQAWSTIAQVSGELSFGSVANAPGFVEAGDALRGRLQAASSVDYGMLAKLIAGHTSTTLNLATTALDLTTGGELRGPARAIARLTREDRDGLRAAVDPGAIQRGLSMPLPPQACDLLSGPLNQVVEESRRLVNATSSLDQLYRSPMAAPRPSEPGERYRFLPPAETSTQQLWAETSIGR